MPLEYAFKKNNLPTEQLTYSPVIQNMGRVGIDDTAKAIAQSIGQPVGVVKSMLSQLDAVLPDLLRQGVVDLGFVVLSLSLSDSVVDQSINYTADNAPLKIKVSMPSKVKKGVLFVIRNDLVLVKNVYQRATPTITGITAYRYLGLKDFNVIPGMSPFVINGLNLSMDSDQSLQLKYTNNPTGEPIVDTLPLEDIIKASNQNIQVGMPPYQFSMDVDYNLFAKLEWVDNSNPSNPDVTTFPTLYTTVFGGLSHLGAISWSNTSYFDLGGVTRFKFTEVDGVVSVQVKVPEQTQYGPAVQLVDGDYTYAYGFDDSTNPVAEFVFLTAPNATSYYYALIMANGGVSYEIDGYREV